MGSRASHVTDERRVRVNSLGEIRTVGSVGPVRTTAEGSVRGALVLRRRQLMLRPGMTIFCVKFGSFNLLININYIKKI